MIYVKLELDQHFLDFAYYLVAVEATIYSAAPSTMRASVFTPKSQHHSGQSCYAALNPPDIISISHFCLNVFDKFNATVTVDISTTLMILSLRHH